MTPKTEELLHFCHWFADVMTQPTMANAVGSFEKWLQRNGLLWQFDRLDERRFIERDSGKTIK